MIIDFLRHLQEICVTEVWRFAVEADIVIKKNVKIRMNSEWMNEGQYPPNL